MDTLESSGHKIYFDTQLAPLTDIIEQGKYSNVFVFADRNTAEACLPVFRQMLDDFSGFDLIETDPGEENKNIDFCIGIWKTLLDIGKPDLAFQLARKALDVWKTETDASYYTFEHFLAKSGRGAGWHQFSGLSSPVLSWFASYYKTGTVTAGFETWIDKKSFNTDNSAFKASLSFDSSTKEHVRTLLVGMNPNKKYQVLFDGKMLKFSVLNRGLLQIELPASNAAGILEIKSLK